MSKLGSMLQSATANVQQKKQEAVKDRLAKSLQSLVDSEQVKLACAAAKDPNMAVDWLADNMVQEVLNPVAQYEDTLRAKGYRAADIRYITRNLYITYCIPPEQAKQVENMTHDQMIGPVANYVLEHQELYNTFENRNV